MVWRRPFWVAIQEGLTLGDRPLMGGDIRPHKISGDPESKVTGPLTFAENPPAELPPTVTHSFCGKMEGRKIHLPDHGVSVTDFKAEPQ